MGNRRGEEIGECGDDEQRECQIAFSLYISIRLELVKGVNESV